jgi:hypothetical protein
VPGVDEATGMPMNAALVPVEQQAERLTIAGARTPPQLVLAALPRLHDP